MNNLKEKVYEALRMIPEGKVTTYKDIATYLGNPKTCRAIGNILHVNKDPDYYPCYKVVNSKGELTNQYAYGGLKEQKRRLENDNIVVIDNKVNLTIYGYTFNNF